MLLSNSLPKISIDNKAYLSPIEHLWMTHCDGIGHNGLEYSTY